MVVPKWWIPPRGIIRRVQDYVPRPLNSCRTCLSKTFLPYSWKLSFFSPKKNKIDKNKRKKKTEKRKVFDFRKINGWEKVSSFSTWHISDKIFCEIGRNHHLSFYIASHKIALRGIYHSSFFNKLNYVWEKRNHLNRENSISLKKTFFFLFRFALYTFKGYRKGKNWPST